MNEPIQYITITQFPHTHRNRHTHTHIYIFYQGITKDGVVFHTFTPMLCWYDVKTTYVLMNISSIMSIGGSWCDENITVQSHLLIPFISLSRWNVFALENKSPFSNHLLRLWRQHLTAVRIFEKNCFVNSKNVTRLRRVHYHRKSFDVLYCTGPFLW